MISALKNNSVNHRVGYKNLTLFLLFIMNLKFHMDTFPVPSEWVFEKFLNLNEKLEGQSVSIKSIFNASDTNPSMIIYLHKAGRYKFNDFSSGISGDCIDLIQLLYKLESRQEAFKKVYAFYRDSDHDVFENTRPTLVKIEKKITEYIVRPWNVDDQKYWTDFKIGSKTLDMYNVKPLSSYTFTITQGSMVKFRTFENRHSYGYFRKDGTLYKIYNPKNIRAKFVKVQNYIQGHDQLEFKNDWLIVMASLKDIMAFKQLKFPIDCIAPDSENTMLTEKQLNYYHNRYKLITVLFDNDTAGKRAALKYKEKHGLHFTSLNVEKDIADCIKEHGLENTRLFLKPELLDTKKVAIQTTQ
jgi:hypothetical protein